MMLKGWSQTPERWEFEKWVWRIASIFVILCAIFFPHLWMVVATVYLAFVSNYALDLTSAGNKQSAQARDAARLDNPSPQEIAEHLVEHTTIERSYGR